MAYTYKKLSKRKKLTVSLLSLPGPEKTTFDHKFYCEIKPLMILFRKRVKRILFHGINGICI